MAESVEVSQGSFEAWECRGVGEGIREERGCYLCAPLKGGISNLVN